MHHTVCMYIHHACARGSYVSVVIPIACAICPDASVDSVLHLRNSEAMPRPKYAPGDDASPLCRLGAIQSGPHSKRRLQPISPHAFAPRGTMCTVPRTKTLPSRQDRVGQRQALSLQLTMVRERVGQTKRVQVRDDVQERYTSSSAFQLRTACTQCLRRQWTVAVRKE